MSLELDITEDFAKEHNLTPEQVAAVKTYGTTKLTETVTGLEEKYKSEASQNADRILDDATKHVAEKTKVARNQGEKAADYVARASAAFLASGESEVQKLKDEYAEKLKNFQGDPETKKELADLKEEVDRLKKIEAEFEPIKGVKQQYDELQSEYGKLKVETAFGKARPAFPEHVNKYEVDVKWSNFKNRIMSTHNIDIIDGEVWAIDKSNEHKRQKLADVANSDAELKELIEAKQEKPGGSGTKPAGELIDVEGVPFKVDANADSVTRGTAIRNYLTNELKLNISSAEYAKKFAEYNAKLIAHAKK